MQKQKNSEGKHQLVKHPAVDGLNETSMLLLLDSHIQILVASAK
ncbi:hypothetical protein Pse7367_0941 [Thalassoporum mexicanum PCC 7367]|nr:hypothetical protein Pse7367_0941 [Pseudanabaena sp. PCC 7367]